MRSIVLAVVLCSAAASAAELLPSGGVGVGMTLDGTLVFRPQLQVYGGADLFLSRAPVLFQLRGAALFGEASARLEPTFGFGYASSPDGLFATTLVAGVGPSFVLSAPTPPRLALRLTLMLVRAVGLELGLRDLGQTPQGSVSIQLDLVGGAHLLLVALGALR